MTWQSTIIQILILDTVFLIPLYLFHCPRARRGHTNTRLVTRIQPTPRRSYVKPLNLRLARLPFFCF